MQAVYIHKGELVVEGNELEGSTVGPAIRALPFGLGEFEADQGPGAFMVLVVLGASFRSVGLRLYNKQIVGGGAADEGAVGIEFVIRGRKPVAR